MKYPPITAELLKTKKARPRQQYLFQKHFGDKPAPLTEEVFTKLASHFDICWAAKHLLGSRDLTEYKKVRDTALSEYEKVQETALVEYVKVRAPALTEYYKATETAMTEYKKAKALAFLTLYKA